nr:hypothetical protein CFP56_08495 [Quercus suber]POF10140.1 hypothetical protein CFP56_74779 [Quercus suber]
MSEIRMTQEAAIRSRKEDEELQRSTKKVKEAHYAITSPRAEERRTSYKERLTGEILSAYEEAFSFEYGMETEVESDNESSDLAAGIVAVNLSGARKANIRAQWTNAPIVKAIGPVLRIDAHTATESRGRFARIFVQINFDKPLIKLIKIGGIEQPMQYQGINSLCFSCGCVGHKMECCPYTTRASKRRDDGIVEALKVKTQQLKMILPLTRRPMGPGSLFHEKRKSIGKKRKTQPKPPLLVRLHSQEPNPQTTPKAQLPFGSSMEARSNSLPDMDMFNRDVDDW